VVQYRGAAKPQILFIGEAPGKNENILGVPFVGPSGQLVEVMIEEAAAPLNGSLKYGFVNVLGCIPYADTKQKVSGGVRPPTKEEVTACSPRLEALFKALKPKGVVFLGKTASSQRKHLTSFLPENVLELQHPAYVLRNGGRMSVPGAHFVSALSQWLQKLNG
jgi:uracil-DNA glycosylase